MKGLIATAAVLLATAGVAMALGSTGEIPKYAKAKILQSEAAGVYSLRYLAGNTGEVTVRIANEKNVTVMKEKITSKTAFERPYNLRSLPDGKYHFSVEEGGQMWEETIHHVKNLPLTQITFSADVQEIAPDRHELVVKKLAHEVVKVKIFSDQGLIFFDGVINEAGSFSKVFDLSKVAAGNVKMHITFNDRLIEREL